MTSFFLRAASDGLPAQSVNMWAQPSSQDRPSVVAMMVAEAPWLLMRTVARDGFKPGKNLWSCGYDEMRWPLTKKRATILFSQGNTTYTEERPWHGRSGGGLTDGDGRVLIGVVQGYEIYPNNRGLYISHQAILRFLKTHWKNAPPQTFEEAVPIKRQRLMAPPRINLLCPS